MTDLLATPPPAETPPAVTPTPTPAPAAGTPAIPAAAAPTDFQNSLPENWITALGDEFAPHADALKNFRSVADIAKSFLHFRKTGPAYPDENSTPQDIERFRTLAKVPETPEGYALTRPESLPDGVLWDDNVAAELAAVAHKYHIPAPALKALAEAQVNAEAKRAADYNAQQAAAQTQLQSELTAVLGKGAEWERNTANIRHLVGTLADKAGLDADSPEVKALFASGASIKILHQVAKLTQEEGIRTPANYGDLRTNQQRARDIETGKDPEWSQKYKDGDPEAIRRVAALYDKKN